MDASGDMKTIGLLGGMSWESTVTYYRIINEAVKATLGGLHSAKILLYSVDFAPIEQYQADGQWDQSARVLTEAACNLERAGADFLVICTNTMHKVAPQIQAHIRMPLLHIADATAEALQKQGINKVALLGTKYTMTQAFYKDRLADAGLTVLIPGAEDIEQVNRIIYEELCLGVIAESSRREYQRIIAALAQQGAQGVILGCTEIGLLIRQEDTSLPIFDTTSIHAAKAAAYAMGIT